MNTSGSGITLYGERTLPLALSASIDGGSAMHYTFNRVDGCCNSTIQPIYNFTLYNITSLSLDIHVLRLTLLDSSFGFPNGVLYMGPSVMLFDYAFVVNPNYAPTFLDSPAKSTSR